MQSVSCMYCNVQTAVIVIFPNFVLYYAGYHYTVVSVMAILTSTVKVIVVFWYK